MWFEVVFSKRQVLNAKSWFSFFWHGIKSKTNWSKCGFRFLHFFFLVKTNIL